MRSSKKDLSEKQLLEQIVEKLDKLILVVALQARPKEEQIKHLAKIGYSNSEMATMLAIPKGTIDAIRASFPKGDRKSETNG
jgi:hypothetical protein